MMGTRESDQTYPYFYRLQFNIQQRERMLLDFYIVRGKRNHNGLMIQNDGIKYWSSFFRSNHEGIYTSLNPALFFLHIFSKMRNLLRTNHDQNLILGTSNGDLSEQIFTPDFLTNPEHIHEKIYAIENEFGNSLRNHYAAPSRENIADFIGNFKLWSREEWYKGRYKVVHSRSIVNLGRDIRQTEMIEARRIYDGMSERQKEKSTNPWHILFYKQEHPE